MTHRLTVAGIRTGILTVALLATPVIAYGIYLAALGLGAWAGYLVFGFDDENNVLENIEITLFGVLIATFAAVGSGRWIAHRFGLPHSRLTVFGVPAVLAVGTAIAAFRPDESRSFAGGRPIVMIVVMLVLWAAGTGLLSRQIGTWLSAGHQSRARLVGLVGIFGIPWIAVTIMVLPSAIGRHPLAAAPLWFPAAFTTDVGYRVFDIHEGANSPENWLLTMDRIPQILLVTTALVVPFLARHVGRPLVRAKVVSLMPARKPFGWIGWTICAVAVLAWAELLTLSGPTGAVVETALNIQAGTIHFLAREARVGAILLFVLGLLAIVRSSMPAAFFAALAGAGIFVADRLLDRGHLTGWPYFVLCVVLAAALAGAAVWLSTTVDPDAPDNDRDARRRIAVVAGFCAPAVLANGFLMPYGQLPVGLQIGIAVAAIGLGAVAAMNAVLARPKITAPAVIVATALALVPVAIVAMPFVHHAGVQLLLFTCTLLAAAFLTLASWRRPAGVSAILRWVGFWIAALLAGPVAGFFAAKVAEFVHPRTADYDGIGIAFVSGAIAVAVVIAFLVTTPKPALEPGALPTRS